MKRSAIAFKNSGRKIDPVSLSQWNVMLDSFEDGTKITVTIENYRRKRSLGQNNLFHWYVDLFAKEIGEDFHALKHELKTRYGAFEPRRDRNGNEVIDESTGEILMRLRSTTELNTEEMGKLIDGTIRLASSIGIILPYPEDLRNNNLK